MKASIFVDYKMWKCIIRSVSEYKEEASKTIATCGASWFNYLPMSSVENLNSASRLAVLNSHLWRVYASVLFIRTRSSLFVVDRK